MLHIKTFSFNQYAERTILLWDDTLEGVVVDPGCCNDEEYSQLKAAIESEKVAIKAIWITHGHTDHVYGANRLSMEYGLPIFMSTKDVEALRATAEMAVSYGMPAPDLNFASIDMEDGQTMSFGNTEFVVIATPGHTMGSVCFFDEKDKVLLSGDTLFAGTIGRTDLPGGSYDDLIVSVMDKLMGLDTDVDIIPGHGPISNIGHERTHNPFLQPFNEPEDNEESCI